MSVAALEIAARRWAAMSGTVRHNWTREEVGALFALPFPELMFRAQAVHRRHFDPTEVQISTLLSIKTGGCPEDCAYCPQSVHYETGVKAERLMSVAAVVAEARARSEEHTSELQSLRHLVCRLLLEKK